MYNCLTMFLVIACTELWLTCDRVIRYTREDPLNDEFYDSKRVLNYGTTNHLV